MASTKIVLHCMLEQCQCLQAKNEVKVLNSLNHPNIVKYYECYQERNMMHIIMEFCQVLLPFPCLCMLLLQLSMLLLHAHTPVA